MKLIDNILYSENDLILRRIADKIIFGNELYLGYTYYINGKLLPEPKLEVPEDYEEVLPLEIEGNTYYLEEYTYAAIKTFVVKLKYSNDDQIALMLNYQENPDKYQEAYDTMQAWRDYAGEVAREYSK